MTNTKEIYKEICFVFARLSLFAFGGPAAHIAMMEDELVTKREWLKKTEFMDLLGFTNLIPGPNSTELAIALGYKRGGKLVCPLVPPDLGRPGPHVVPARRRVRQEATG